MHEILVNRLGGLSLPRKSVVRLTDRPDMTLDVYRGRKTTIQHVSVIISLVLQFLSIDKMAANVSFSQNKSSSSERDSLTPCNMHLTPCNMKKYCTV